MRRRISTFRFFLFAFLVIPYVADAGRIEPMYRMAPSAHHAANGVETDAIRRAVVTVAERHDWRTQIRENGFVEAELWTQGGKHRAIVLIEFDNKNFNVRYVDSHNLGYTKNYCHSARKIGNPNLNSRESCIGEAIHPYYNDWVETLESAIPGAVFELKPGSRVSDAEPTSATPAIDSKAEGSLLVADELRKLKALENDGVITPTEFETQKRRLLR